MWEYWAARTKDIIFNEIRQVVSLEMNNSNLLQCKIIKLWKEYNFGVYTFTGSLIFLFALFSLIHFSSFFPLYPSLFFSSVGVGAYKTGDTLFISS